MTPPTKTTARDRLLEAACKVFAREGLDGATTRAIAREAGVNEVTLFRNFGSKEKLLAEVVGQRFPNSCHLPQLSDSGDLETDLLSYAQLYETTLAENLPLIRTLIGAGQHLDSSQERQVFMGIFLPLKQALIGLLNRAAQDGRISPAAEPAMLADLFHGMFFTQVLRRANPYSCPEYNLNDYRRLAVHVLLQGAAAHGATEVLPEIHQGLTRLSDTDGAAT